MRLADDCESHGASARHSLEDALRGQPAIERNTWCSGKGLNLRRPVLQTGALPSELPLHGWWRGANQLAHAGFDTVETSQNLHWTLDTGGFPACRRFQPGQHCVESGLQTGQPMFDPTKSRHLILVMMRSPLRVLSSTFGRATMPSASNAPHVEQMPALARAMAS